MGFKKRNRKPQPKKAYNKRNVTKVLTLGTTEEERVDAVTKLLLDYNREVRGFKEAGSCITDSMLFVAVWNKLFPDMPAEAVCTDLAAFSKYQEVTLWHKGHDGDDPNWPEHRSNPRYYGPNGGGYDGHVVVRTPNFIIDPTIGQINREVDGQQVLGVPMSTRFNLSDCTPLEDYDEELTEIFTRSKPTQMRIREQVPNGTSRSQGKIVKEWVQDLVLMRPQSLAPKKVFITDFETVTKVRPTGVNKRRPARRETLITVVAWALRPDIDFATELAIHRADSNQNLEDYWDRERAVHAKRLMKRIRRMGLMEGGE